MTSAKQYKLKRIILFMAMTTLKTPSYKNIMKPHWIFSLAVKYKNCETTFSALGHEFSS